MQSVDEPFHDAETDLSFSTEIKVVKFLEQKGGVESGTGLQRFFSTARRDWSRK